MDVEVKVEPSSPPTTPPPIHVDTSEKEAPAEGILGSYSSETSEDSMDSSQGILEGTTEPSLKKPKKSVNNLHKCDLCGRCFSRADHLKRHQIVHASGKEHFSTHKCDLCGRCFARAEYLKRHQTLHTSGKQHFCTLCSRRFPCEKSLILHQFTHTTEKPFACTFCDIKFLYIADFTKHKRVHTGEVPYACRICPSKYCTKESLDRHGQLHAAGVEMFNCPECGKAFKRERYLREHLNWHRVEKPHSCHLCPAKFATEHHLNGHVLTHTSEKRHKCAVCERDFKRQNDLKRHMATIHVGVKVAVASTDSRVEMPSSPLSMQPTDPLDVDRKGQSELPVPLPRIISVTTSTGSTESPGSAAITDSDCA